MSLPLAALGALIAALLETSVLPELRIAEVKPDLVLALCVVAAMIVGVEEGMVWAFVGGLMLDMLSVERPLGATTLSLLLVLGVAVLVSRVLGPNRTLASVLSAFALTWLYHAALLAILAVTANVALGELPVRALLIMAVLNAIIALPAALVMRGLMVRFAPPERAW